MRLDVEDWGPHFGVVIVDNDAELKDEDGNYSPIERLCVAGFKSKAAAWRWLRVHEMARALGVRHGFRLGIGYAAGEINDAVPC